MSHSFLDTFSKLPTSNKAMVYLMWIFAIGNLISDVFVTIYVFRLQDSIEDLIFYRFIFYIATFLGFVLVGILFSQKHRNIKKMYPVSYLFFILAFACLLFQEASLFSLYTFILLYSFGNGLFWNALHSQELKNIARENRGFYSSAISAGRNIINIVIPVVAAAIFYFADLQNWNGYYILFAILPFVYMTAFFVIKNIDDYTPKPIRKIDITNFFNLKKYKYGHLYYVVNAFWEGVNSVAFPLAMIYFLKSEVNIALFEGILTLISTFLVVHFSFKRNDQNRWHYFAILSLIFAIANITFAYNLSLIFYIWFALLGIFIGPLYSVSAHVYNLYLMDHAKAEKSDFYPAMIWRDFVLFFGRLGAMGILFFIFHTTNSTETFLQYAFSFIAMMMILNIWVMHLWEKYEKNINQG